MNFDAVQKSLRQSAGIDLTKSRRIPSNWVVVKEEIVSGDETNFIVRMGVYPDTFTGFSKGRGQQTSGGYMGLGNKNLGIEIEVEDMTTGEFGSDRTFEDVSFERQDEFFRQALTVISRTIMQVSATATPQERQGSIAQVGTQRNPSDWLVGDKVNVSRSELDSGGLTIGYVVRVYPTTVDVLFPSDDYHNQGWTHEEKKNDLIYAGHDDNWRDVANKWLGKEFYGESIEIGDKSPSWTELIGYNKRDYKLHIGDPSPIPTSSNVWAESDAVRIRLIQMLRPYLLYEDPITFRDMNENQAIEGFEPYTGILRRRL